MRSGGPHLRFLLTLSFWLVASSGLAADEAIAAQPFDRLSAAAGVTVHVAFADTYDVRTVVRRGDANRLQVEFQSDTLLVSRDTTWGPNGERNHDRFDVYLTTPKLTSATARSGAHVIIPVLEMDAFSALSEKGAYIEMSDVRVNDLALEALTGGDIRADGECGQMTVVAETGGSVLADHLTCESIAAEATSGGMIRVFATEVAMLSASDGATLVLSGTARVLSETVESWATLRNWSKPVSD